LFLYRAKTGTRVGNRSRAETAVEQIPGMGQKPGLE